MDTTPAQAAGRITRANTPKNIYKDTGKTREELLGTSRGHVRNAEGGIAYLEKQGYALVGQDFTPAALSHILLLLAQGASHPALMEGVRAIALIMERDQREYEAKGINDIVEKSMEKTVEKMSETLMRMNDATEYLHSSATQASQVLKEFKEECHVITQQLGESAEDMLTELGIAATSQAQTPQGTEGIETREQGSGAAEVTYARAHLPPSHGTTIARNDVKERQVLIDKAPGLNTNGLEKLTETELVAKGAAALALMGMEAGDAPAGIQFWGVRKLRNGGVVYEMNSKEAARWLKSEGVMTSFLAKYGGKSIIKNRAFTIVVEYVPTTINLDTESQAKWIKPPSRRTEGQRTAHLLLGLKNQEAANKLIGSGMYIAGKKVWARKLIQEPRRCMKCQRLGTGHLAAECNQVSSTCGTCAGIHRTEGCQVSNERELKCVNCQIRGHASWDRLCPSFLESAAKYTARNPENLYKYFPTGDPETWEQRRQPVAFQARSPEQEGETQVEAWPYRQERHPDKGRKTSVQKEQQKTKEKEWPQFGAGVAQERGRGQGFNVGGPREGGGGAVGAGEGTRGGKKRAGSRDAVAGRAKQTQGLTQTTIMGFMARDTTIAAAVEEAVREEESGSGSTELREANYALERARKELEEIRAAGVGQGDSTSTNDTDAVTTAHE